MELVGFVKDKFVRSRSNLQKNHNFKPAEK